MSKIYHYRIKNICKKLGAKRVSKEFIEEIERIIIEEAEKIIKIAMNFSKAANRNTIIKKDIEIAIEEIKE